VGGGKRPRYLAFPALVDVVAGDVLLLLREFSLEVSLELARVVRELGDVVRQAVEDGLFLLVVGEELDGVVDLEEQGQDHGVVCGLVLCVGGGCCRGRVGLETVDEVLEEGEAGLGAVLCGVGDALSDCAEAGVEDGVAGDLGGEGVDPVPAGVALLVDVALLPSDEGALVDVGVALDVGVVRELELVPLGVVERHRGSVRVAVAEP
jgi:hypothetical protein